MFEQIPPTETCCHAAFRNKRNKNTHYLPRASRRAMTTHKKQIEIRTWNMNNAIRRSFLWATRDMEICKITFDTQKNGLMLHHHSCVEWRRPSRCACFTLEHSQKGRSNKNGKQTQKKRCPNVIYNIFIASGEASAEKNSTNYQSTGQKYEWKNTFFFCENDSWKFVFNWRVFSGLLPHLQYLFCERPPASVLHTWSVNRHLASRWQWLMVDKNGMEIPQLVLQVWWSLAASVRPPKWIYRSVQHSDIRHISVTNITRSAYGGQWVGMNWTNVHLFRFAWRGNALRQIPLRRTSHSIWI